MARIIIFKTVQHKNPFLLMENVSNVNNNNIFQFSLRPVINVKKEQSMIILNIFVKNKFFTQI